MQLALKLQYFYILYRLDSLVAMETKTLNILSYFTLGICHSDIGHLVTICIIHVQILLLGDN